MKLQQSPQSFFQISSFLNSIYLLQMFSLWVFLVKSTNTLDIRMKTQETHHRWQLLTEEFGLTLTTPILDLSPEVSGKTLKIKYKIYKFISYSS